MHEGASDGVFHQSAIFGTHSSTGTLIGQAAGLFDSLNAPFNGITEIYDSCETTPVNHNIGILKEQDC